MWIFSLLLKKDVRKKESYRVYNKKKYNESQNYVFPKGTTGIIEETKKLWKDIEVSDEPVPMDIV